MGKIKRIFAAIIGITLILGSSVMVSAKNDEFSFYFITSPQVSDVNVKEDTEDAVVTTLRISNTSNSVGYCVIGYNRETGKREKATTTLFYDGAKVLGKKYIPYNNGYAWVGANRYLEGQMFYSSPYFSVNGRWAS